MKNLLLKICLIAISVLVSTSTAYAVADDGSNVLSLDEQFFELLLADQQVTRPNIDPKKIWAQNKGDNRGQNMYMMILNEVDDKPFKDAIEELSTTISFPHSKTGEEVFFSQEDWKNIYVGRSMAPITQKLGLGINAANAYHSIMLSYVTQQVNSNEFVNNLRAKSMASTIFMDGDLTNSGFDLINDLDIIELILFGSIEEGPYDRALGSVGLPPRPTLGGENFTSASGEIITGDLSSESSGASTSSTVASVFPPADQSFADDEKEFPEATSKKAAMLYNPTGLHPLECETDNNIGEAVDDYIDDLPNGNKFEIPKPDKGDGEDSGDRDDSSETAEKDDSGDAKGDDDGHSVDDDAESSPEDTFDDIDPAKEYEWETPTLCNGIFCIEIIFANDEDGRGTYKANDNCIACHMEFLLANMERLLSKTLTPSKAPGNLFESGKCKKGFTQIKPNINIYAIKKPIPTPPETNPMFQSSNPFEDFQREMSEGYGTGKGGKVSRFTKHIVQYSENRTLSSVLTEVDKAASTTQAELDTNREISNIQQAINIKVQKHQDISAGLEQTSTYFSSMGQSLAEVNSGACEALRGKKSCE